jgi:DNA replication protein DnaC
LGLLLEGNYRKNAQNELIVAPTGCGKSFLACALGHHACAYGHKTAYFNMNRFIKKMTLARLDGSFIKLLNHLERQNIIILGDFGLQPLTYNIRFVLLQLLEDRYGRMSRSSSFPSSRYPYGMPTSTSRRWQTRYLTDSQCTQS